MHIPPSPWLFITATLLHPATAFYPYQYGDDTPSKSSRAILPSTNANAQGITLPLHRIPSLSSRQNTYNILQSTDPKASNSVAIDQDGGDISYMVGLTIGDSKTEYHLLLDSAASNTWIMAKECTNEACKSHNTFGKEDSSTLKTQSTPFSITYGTGSVSGSVASDTIHIGSLNPQLTFGLASTVSTEFSSYPMDGILGIGRGAKNVAGSISAPQIMDVLSSSKLIPSKMYGIHLSRASDGTADGELNFGSANKDRFTGDLVWSTTMDNEKGFWEIPVANAGIDGKTLDITGRSAIIDTGTSFVLMPEADAVKLHSPIQGSKQDGETFSVPCDTKSIVQFTINKTAFNISTADWRGGKLASGLCRSNVIGRQTFGEKQWLVGDVFLKNVYSVFDFDGKRVGFGTKSATAQSAQASSAGASTPSSTASSTAIVPAASGGLINVPPSAISGSIPNPTVAAESQPQGQKGQQGVARKLNVGAWAVSLGFGMGVLAFF